MSKSIFAAALGLGLSFSAIAQDAPAANATLTDIKGKVSVNQGDGFVPASEGMRVKPGDLVKSGATLMTIGAA